MKKFLHIFVGIILLIAGFRFYMSANLIETDHKEAAHTIEDFAKCLKDSGIIMYGVDTCDFCAQQKRRFGAAFDHIEYVNCQFNQEFCTENGITNFPSWKIGDTVKVGVLSFSELETLTNCKKPITN